jgi:uncharacterized protein (DUF305 family)
MSPKLFGACIVLALTAATPVAAQDHSAHHGQMAATGEAAKAPSSQAFAAANDAMHKDMAIEFTGDADVDFVAGMIPHHEGAIAMAKVQLEYGKDPEIRKLAEAVIAAQTAEIADMKEWLKAHAK